MKNTIIRCNSKEEYKAVLKKLEEKGCTWLSGNKPTEKGYYNEGYESIVVDDNILTASSGVRVRDGFEIITADDFIGNKPIVIYRVGRTVVALNQNTNETGVAKCHPTDDFDFSVGAKLAFERLLSNRNTEVRKEKPEEPKKAVKFKVGDRVRLKKGLEIGKRYGGSACPLTLLSGEMCTTEQMTIECISFDGNYYCSNGFYYSPDMLEKCDMCKRNKFEVGDRVRVKGNLVSGCKYGGLTLLAGMNCTNEVLKITYVYERDTSNRYDCSNGFVYDEEMLEPINGFRVGDIVTVNLNATVGRQYGGLTLLKDMAEYGKPLKIEEVHKTSEGVFYTCSNRFAYNEQMLKHYDDEITIGCTVEVTDAGKSYTSYAEWVDKNVDNADYKVRYNYGVDPRKGFVGKVIAIAPHLSINDRNLVYFKRGDECYLINAEGVKKV